MRVLALHWVGTRTGAYRETTSFFREVLGLTPIHDADGFAVLQVPDGATVEVFGPDSEWNRHLVSPVAGFLVEDLDEALRDLEHAGVEIVLPLSGGEERRWLHFRAPDGFVYELVQESAG